jgi:hypothetical protein
LTNDEIKKIGKWSGVGAPAAVPGEGTTVIIDMPMDKENNWQQDQAIKSKTGEKLCTASPEKRL